MPFISQWLALLRHCNGIHDYSLFLSSRNGTKLFTQTNGNTALRQQSTAAHSRGGEQRQCAGSAEWQAAGGQWTGAVPMAGGRRPQTGAAHCLSAPDRDLSRNDRGKRHSLSAAAMPLGETPFAGTECGKANTQKCMRAWECTCVHEHLLRTEYAILGPDRIRCMPTCNI